MKGIRLFFAACLAPLAFHGAIADDYGDTARAATRRNAATTVVSSNRQTSTTPASMSGTGASRTTNLNVKSAPTVRDRVTGPRSGNVVSNSNRGGPETTPQSVSARTTANIQSRGPATPARTTTAARTATSPVRTTTVTRNGKNTSRAAISRGATTTRTTGTSNARAAISRNATTAAEIMNRDYKKCREVYYNCMDEFCANKDAQLKRCACSSRVNEFDGIKKQLSNIDDKMLDFNQRLLTVNMDKEDAAALFKATEGELAFNQKDTSDSKKMLDEIAKKLNTSFDSSNFDQNLSALSWSLNMDAAFDSVDSMMGASTTTKTGTDLYSAALPVCREMAMEVCTDDELAIATNGYQMMIEQDCNTVAKSYATQTDAAREKVREGAALLDMSRLDVYQKRNSDDILTCKKKMLDMLTDTTVCGNNLGKCLDTSGRYIDPSTGEAFLTENLADLGNLITRPGAGETWTGAPGNDKFITYLNSKKKYLESAMENCQDIADYVWDEFIEDALAQIKLAQESKLEEMRQSCTTLTTQCLSDTADSLADFDARALSTFGVAADKTVNAMCADVRNACTALLDTTGGGMDWSGGMTEIANNKTYETIMQTCREVGRACIIQACKSISGNFGLCENIQTSVNRKAIINRTSCWKEVQECVASAGADNIKNIMSQLNITDNFYATLYGEPDHIIKLGTTQYENTPAPQSDTTDYTPECIKSSLTGEDALNCVFDICTNECAGGKDTPQCQICRLSEKIWGNCEVSPVQSLEASNTHNRIKKPINDQTTLLYWFATNTSTENMDDSCRDTTCGIGFVTQIDTNGNIICYPEGDMINGAMCPSADGYQNIYVETNGLQNCCGDVLNNKKYTKDAFGHCCLLDQTNTISQADVYYSKTPMKTQQSLCLPKSGKYVLNVSFNGTAMLLPTTYLICIPDDTNSNELLQGDEIVPTYPSGKKLQCNGKYVFVDIFTKMYYEPHYNITGKSASLIPIMFYDAPTPSDYKCKWIRATNNTGGGTWETTDACTVTSPRNWKIQYGDNSSATGDTGSN